MVLLIQLMQGDCLEEMKKIPTDSVDLILCDPPYGTIKDLKYENFREGTSSRKLTWDSTLDLEALFKEYDRVLKLNGRVILFSQEPFTTQVRSIHSESIKFSYPLIWLKNCTGNPLQAGKKPLNYHEDISVFRKEHDSNMKHPLRPYAKKCLDAVATSKAEFNKEFGKPGGFFCYHDAITFKLCSKRKYDEVVDKYNLRQYDWFKEYEELKEIDKNYQPFIFNKRTEKAEKSVLEYSKESPSYHPTQKPTKLLEHLIEMYSNEGMTVLDNCMGGGSTGVACLRTNRNFIGIELDEEFFKVAKERIEKEGG